MKLSVSAYTAQASAHKNLCSYQQQRSYGATNQASTARISSDLATVLPTLKVRISWHSWTFYCFPIYASREICIYLYSYHINALLYILYHNSFPIYFGKFCYTKCICRVKFSVKFIYQWYNLFIYLFISTHIARTSRVFFSVLNYKLLAILCKIGS